MFRHCLFFWINFSRQNYPQWYLSLFRGSIAVGSILFPAYYSLRRKNIPYCTGIARKLAEAQMCNTCLKKSQEEQATWKTAKNTQREVFAIKQCSALCFKFLCNLLQNSVFISKNKTHCIEQLLDNMSVQNRRILGLTSILTGEWMVQAMGVHMETAMKSSALWNSPRSVEMETNFQLTPFLTPLVRTCQVNTTSLSNFKRANASISYLQGVCHWNKRQS